jgi:hypothetical protein
MIDSPNVTAELDDPLDVSDEVYDSMQVAGVAVASGQFIHQSIKLAADVKRAINQKILCQSSKLRP